MADDNEDMDNLPPAEKIEQLQKALEKKETERKRLHELLEQSKQQALKDKEQDELDELLREHAKKTVPQKNLEEELADVQVENTEQSSSPSQEYRLQQYQSLKTTYSHVDQISQRVEALQYAARDEQTGHIRKEAAGLLEDIARTQAYAADEGATNAQATLDSLRESVATFYLQSQESPNDKDNNQDSNQ